MLSLPVFTTLIIVSSLGFLLGAFYYLRPEKVVARRIKKEHRELAQKDREFRRWLEVEIQAQVRKIRRIGLIMLILEAVMMMLILVSWQNGQGS